MRISPLVLLLFAMIGCGSGNRTSTPPVASYKTPDAATVKKHMTPAQLALGDPVVNSVGMQFRLLPGGTFTMGSPDTEYGRRTNESDEIQHQVKITKPFYLGEYEVTQQQYEKVMGGNPSKFKGPQNPVEKVNWNDAVEFCRKLSSLPEEKAAGYVYRLPTEAEWEYACRAGTQTKYSFGDSELELADYAWYYKNGQPLRFASSAARRDPALRRAHTYKNSGRTTHPVGGKKPNAWGLYDMHGNVYEWCQDWYGDYPSGSVTDPTGAARALLPTGGPGGG